jgi:anaerobic selenocysteine-containing dehydrogenase
VKEKLTVTRRTFLKAAAVTGAAAAAFSPEVGPLKGLVKAEKAPVQTPEVKLVKSACRACIHNCGVLVHVQDGRVVKIEGNPEYPMSRGALCSKGLSGIQALYHPNRLKYPLKRVGARGEGKWQRISWDEAIDTIAQKLMETRDKYGAETVFCSTGGGGNPAFSSIRRFCNAFGTPNWVEPGAAQCYLPRTFIYGLVYGGITTSIADSQALELYFPEDCQTQCLVLWGTVPAYDSPAGAGRCLADLRAKGVKTVVIDPRLTPDAAKADIWLPIRPGTDTALLLSWIKYIIDEGLDDKEFVTKWTNGPFLVNTDTKLLLRESDVTVGGDPNVFVVWDNNTNSAKAWPFPGDETVDPALFGSYTVEGMACKPAYQLLKDRADEFPIEKAAEICWLPADKIKEAIELYATNKPSGLILGVATDQHVNSVQSAMGAALLDVIIGNVEKPGALLQRFKSAPSMNMLTDLKPLLPNEQLLKRLGMVEHKGTLSWWMAHIPTLLNAVFTGQPYKPRVWIERSGNKLAMLGNATQGYQAIKEMDFIVHMYMYPTSFSAMADILLPATEWLETNLPVTSCNMIFARQEVVHLWETRDETLFWAKLAERLAELGHEGCQAAFDPSVVTAPQQPYWRSIEEYLDRAVASLNMTWDEFKEKAPITFAPLDEWRQYYTYEQLDPETGKPVGFRTPSKKLEIYLESLLVIGRTGGTLSPIPLPPASQDYEPLPHYMEPGESPYSTPDIAQEYPLILTSGRIPFYHHGTLRNIPWLRELYPVPELWINPDTAAGLAIKTGEWVWIESLRGKIRAKAYVTEGIPPKVVYMERFWYPELPETDPSLYGWRESNVNILTKNDPPYNPEVGTYTVRGFQVKVYKAPEGAPAGVWQKPEEFAAWLPQPPGEV